MNPAIEVDGLVKRYGPRTVVDGVSFSVPRGRLLALLGRNGAGKTTTVECVEGFRTPDGGRIRVLDADPTTQRHRIANRLGVMLQDGGAYQAASPREMLALYAKLFSRSRPVDELLGMTGLTGVADARFRTLSGGEKQRVNLALALVGTPEVLFLDEPTAGMDTAARHATWEIVSRLRDDGTTILLTTHYLEEAQRLADELVIVHEGRVAAAGTLADLTGGPEQVVITTTDDTEEARLSQVLRVPVVTLAPGRYAVQVPAEQIPVLTASLAAAGIRISGIAAQQPDLEQVFLSLTGGGA